MAERCYRPVLRGLSNFIKSISMQKYSTVLYLRGKNQQSSLIGGLLTLICAVGLMIFMAVTLNNIFSKSHYNLDQTAKPL